MKSVCVCVCVRVERESVSVHALDDALSNALADTLRQADERESVVCV